MIGPNVRVTDVETVLALFRTDPDFDSYLRLEAVDEDALRTSVRVVLELSDYVQRHPNIAPGDIEAARWMHDTISSGVESFMHLNEMIRTLNVVSSHERTWDVPVTYPDFRKSYIAEVETLARPNGDTADRLGRVIRTIRLALLFWSQGFMVP